MKNLLRIGMLLCMFLLGSVGWAMAEESITYYTISDQSSEEHDGSTPETAVNKGTLDDILTEVNNNSNISDSVVVLLPAGQYSATSSFYNIKKQSLSIVGLGNNNQDVTLTSPITVELEQGGYFSLQNLKISFSGSVNEALVKITSSNTYVTFNNTYLEVLGSGTDDSNNTFGVYSANGLHDNTIDFIQSELHMSGRCVRGLAFRGGVGHSLNCFKSIVNSEIGASGHDYVIGLGVWPTDVSNVKTNPVSIQLKDSKIDVNYYAIITCNSNDIPVNIDIENSEITAWSAVYLRKNKDNNNLNFTHTISVKNSNLKSRSFFNGTSDGFAALVFQYCPNVQFTIDANSTITSENMLTDVTPQTYLCIADIRGGGGCLNFIPDESDTSKKCIVTANSSDFWPTLFMRTYGSTLTVTGTENAQFLGKEKNQCFLLYDSKDNFKNAITDDYGAMALASSGDHVLMPEGTYNLSEQLTINKAITLEGASNGTTTLKRTSAWNNTDNSSKHMVNITTSGVTLKNLVIDGNNLTSGATDPTKEGSGINVYQASNVTLENVISKNNKGGGLIVNGSQVTAKNFHTEGNGYGINLDKGQEVTTDPTLTIEGICSVAETSKIYGPATLDPNSVTRPDGWITTTVKIEGTDYRVWTDKVITTSENTVFANGYPVTITASETSDKVKIYRTAYPSDFVEVPSASAVVFGGSKDANVESTSITMESGQVVRIYGGGHGSSSANKASVRGTATLILNGGTITNSVFGGGYLYSSVKDVAISNSNTSSSIQIKEWLISAGFENGRTDGETYVEFNQSNNTVETATLTLNGGTYCYIGFGGTDGAKGYVKETTATLQNATITGGVFGNGSNGRSDKVTATLEQCTFSPSTYPIEIAAVNRGKSKEVNLTFKNCTFPEDENKIYAYLGATYHTLLGYTGSEYGVPEQVSFTFEGGTNVPKVGVSDGLGSASVTLTGAKGYIAPFAVDNNTTISEFTIPDGKTWTFNNGLELTSDVTLTQTGTLVVNGTMKVTTQEQAAQAILKGNAAVIDASTLTADVVLTKMGSTEATLKKGIKVIFSDNTAYTDSESAKADLAGAKYIVWEDSKFVLKELEKDTPTIDDKDKPVGSTIDAGMPISASVLKGGSAKVGEKVVAGTFSWKNGAALAQKGTNSYAVIFTPQDQINYNSLETTAEIKDVKAYAIVEPGVSMNGKVVIENENIAHKYEVGTELTVKAIPNEHYTFSSWANELGSEATITYIVPETDATLVANFERIKHTVSFGEGIIVKNGEATLTSGASIAEGTILTVTASKAGSALTSLTCNGVAIINNQVTVDKALNIEASFESTQQPIVTVTATNGKVMLYDSKGNTIALGSEVAQGTVVTIVAVPDLGYKAGNLTATGVSVENNQFTMGASDVALTQTFNKLQFEVKTVAENATITLDNSNSPVEYGTTITLSAATAYAGYKLLGVFVNGKEIKVNDKFTVTAATTVKAVTAQLPAIQFVDKDQTVTYNGQPQAYVPNTVPAGISGFTIKYNGSEIVPTNAGTYTVNITRNADDVYAAVDESFTFTIKKAKKNVGIPTASQVLSSPADNQFYWIGTASNGLQTIRYQLTAEDAQNYYVEDMVIATTEGEATLTKFRLSRPAQTTLLSAKAALRATAVNLTLTGIGGSIEAYLGSVQVTESTPLYAGQTITLVARPDAGNSSLATWTGVTLDNGNGTATLTLGNEAATVTATFAAKGEAPIGNQNMEGTYNGTVLAGKTIMENTLSNNWRYSFVKAGMTIDNPINAGVYDIVAKRSEDEMYAMTEKPIGKLTIKQAEATVSSVSATAILPNETLNQSVLSGVANVDGVFTWKNPDTQLSATTTNVPVLFTPTSSNYKSVETKTTVTVRSIGENVTPRTLQLTVTGQEMGEAVTITLDGATVVSGTSISAGQTLKVTYAAKSGYRAKATINGSSYSSGNAYTIPDNAKNVEIKVEYYVYVAPNPDPTPDPDPVIPTVSNPVVAERTATTAAVTWEKVSGATSYKLFLYAKKTDSTPLKIYEFDKDGKLKATAISFTLTGLEEGKAYYVETAAYNASGTLLVKKSVELSATPTGIEAISEGSQLYTVKGAIVVAPAEPLQVAIYSVTGQTLFNDEVSYLTQVPAKAGIYVVVIQKGNDRITEKVIVK